MHLPRTPMSRAHLVTAGVLILIGARRRPLLPVARLFVGVIVWLRVAAVPAQTLEAAELADPPLPATVAPVAMFAHPDTIRFWLSGEANIMVQYHPPFHCPPDEKCRQFGTKVPNDTITHSLNQILRSIACLS
ncbi:MAG: hypothetical protein ACHQ9S_26435 [Candidatus Binatia bacterium]